MIRPAVLALGLLHCGGVAVIDGGDGGAGGNGAGGGGSDSREVTTTGSTNPANECERALCGTFCQPSPDQVGHCDGAGSCVAEVFGSALCPAAADVLQGSVCALEAYVCASDDSCSGSLVCICGSWTLINPC